MRKLATIKKIDEVKSIPDAEKIEAYRIGGWWVVDSKDKYKTNDLVVFLETDSWVPNALAPFLTKKDRDPKEYKGVKGERLRTVKLRGQLSQGLLLPISIFEWAGKDQSSLYKEDDDVTDILGILKWEATLPAELSGVAKGNFPSFIPKTDQNRIQNLTKELEIWNNDGSMWEVTEKLDGSSMTVYVRQIDLKNPLCVDAGVCSRNYDLEYNEDNTFWKTAITLDLIGKLQNSGRSLALQGELVGPGIQGNQYEFTEHKFFVFDIYDIDNQRFMLPVERQDFCIKNNIDHAPTWDSPVHLYETSTEELLRVAEGVSTFNNNSKREGLVFKHMMKHDVSFKVISNSWLLENE